MPRKPGHHEGVRRFQRYGQTALTLSSRTLDERFSLSEPDQEAVDACTSCAGVCTGACDDEEEILAFTGTCQSCGRYLDVRQHERCPSPCDGYIG